MTSTAPLNSASEPPQDSNSDWLEIGRVVGPQGLQGELRVYPSSDFPERFVVPGTRWLQQGPKAGSGAVPLNPPTAVELLSGRFIPNKGLYVICLADVASRDEAEALRNARLLVPKGDRPPLEAGEYHVCDLLGLAVYHQATGQLVGTVVDIREAGNDLLEVACPPPDASGKPRTVFIPFVEPIVPVVDLAQRRIEITPPVGLLELG